MSSIAQPASPPPAVPTIYRLQRRLFAASIVLGAAAIVIAAFANPPYYGSGPGTASAVATNAAEGDLMDQTHVIAQLIAAFLLPIGFLVMAWLANRRAPWLASVGAFLAILGFLPLSLYVGQDALYYDLGRWGGNPLFIDLVERWNATGVMGFYGIAFGVGSVFGPTVLGIALWRARVVPVWAAICLIMSRLPSFVFGWAPYHVLIGIVLAGVVLLFISSLPIALAVLRVPYQASQGAVEELAHIRSST
jgi:hypothetical protein